MSLVVKKEWCILGIKIKSLLIGIMLSSVYGGIAFYTTLLKGTGIETLFISSGVLLVPVGAAFLWVLESTGIVSDPGMGGGILIFVLSSYVFWFIVFSLLSYFGIKKYAAYKNH